MKKSNNHKGFSASFGDRSMVKFIRVAEDVDPYKRDHNFVLTRPINRNLKLIKLKKVITIVRMNSLFTQSVTATKKITIVRT